MARRGGLGRGLDALIPDRRSGKPANSIHDTAEEGSEKIAENPVRDPSPDEMETAIDDFSKEKSAEISSDYFESDLNNSGESSSGEMSEESFRDPNGTGMAEEGLPESYLLEEEHPAEDISEESYPDEGDSEEAYQTRDNSDGAYPEGENPEVTNPTEELPVGMYTVDEHLEGVYRTKDNSEVPDMTEESQEGTYPTEKNPEEAFPIEERSEEAYPSEEKSEGLYIKEESFESVNTEAEAPDRSYADPEAAEGETSEVRNDQVVKMRISLVEPNREQPRKYFDDQAIEELSDSIRQFGIIQPLLVQKKEDYFEIIAGERRWRAAKKAGLKEVPVIVKNFSNQEAVEVSLIENIQREDLNPIEEAKAYDRLVREYGLSQEAVAGRVSKSRSSVTNSMRLLKLEPSVQQMVETGQISEGHARAILGLPAPSVQKEMAEQVVKAHLSVRQTEKMVRDIVHPKAAPEEKEKNKEMLDEAVLQDIEEKLKLSLGTRVRINQSGKKGGRIEIEYYSFDDLDRLFELLRSAHEE